MGRSTWLRRVPLLVTAITMTGFGLTGIASAQSITDTGPNSYNSIDNDFNNNCTVRNNNNVSVNNNNRQNATSGDATVKDNTGGFTWDGWSALDPAVAQANGQSYNSWRNGVTNWMSQRSSGNNWNGPDNNLSWSPNGGNWDNYDPMAWQANGQNFGNWWNNTQSYLDNNSSAWLLQWPSSANHDGNFGGGGSASTGDATNSNNTNFTIRINNAASAAAGVNACGQSLFVPPAVSNVSSSASAAAAHAITAAQVTTPSQNASSVSGSGGLGGGAGFSTSQSPSSSPFASSPVATPASATNAPSSAVASSASASQAVVPSEANISNTGPGSSNEISNEVRNNVSVTNNNNICVTNTNNQTASTGDATVNNNTNAGGGSTGSSGNSNGTGLGASLAN